MRMVLRYAAPLMVVLAAGCGTNPSTPSSTATSIAGTVRRSSAIPTRVTVSGSSVGTTTSSSGQFTLTAVPAGNITLVFEANGNTARLPLGVVQAGDHITITVTVEGANATLESREDDHDDDNEDHEVEGKIAGLTGGCPNLTFGIGSTTVKTSGSTQFKNVSCSALVNGMEIEADGTQSGSVLQATQIKKD